jgi:hypothetical protein
MSGDAISDLVLAAVGAFLYVANRGRRPGIALACGTIGVAAALGVACYLGVTEAVGPHRFLSLMSSCAGLPLLADSLTWPDGEPARTRRGAVLFLFMGTLLAVLLFAALGFKAWKEILPALSALLLLFGTLRARRVLPLLGAGLLIATFVLLVGNVSIRPMSADQILHYGLSAALLLMAAPREKSSPRLPWEG